MDTRTLLGLNIRRLRVARGLSQERLAFEAEIDRAYVGRIERGGENVTIDRIDAVAKVLNVAVAELFDVAAVDGERPAGLRPGRKPRP